MGDTSILIVDDEEAIRLSLSVLLKREGHSIDEAANGKEALEKLGSKKYDIVISDIMMPELDGIELLQKIKELNRRIDVIMITAYASLERAVDSLKFGASDFIQKPYENRMIVEAVTKVIENRKLEVIYQEENKLPFEFTTGQRGTLKKLFEIGLTGLAESFKKVAGVVDVEVIDLEVDELGKFPEYLGDEGVPLVGAYVGIYGDMTGNFMMLFDKEDSVSLIEFVTGEKMEVGVYQSEFTERVLTELGDILAASYLSSLRFSIDGVLKATKPSFVNFLSGTIMSFLEVRIGKGTQYSIVSTVKMTIHGETQRTIVGYLISSFGLRSMRVLSEKIK